MLLTMPATSDLELWKSVADREDRDAFEQLFRRHELALINLALHITRNRDEAEDALQEALARAWTSAKSFRVDGNVRAWLLRIVARESIRKLNKRQKDRVEMGLNENISGAEYTPEQEAEKSDLLKWLHKNLAKLPELDRRLLALQFGGELSQDEIAEMLNVSQATVSGRIKKALERLRSNLATAGIAASAPLLETLSEAFQSGHSVPANFADKVWKRYTHPAQKSLRRAALRGPAAALKGSLIAVAVVAAFSAAGLYWWSTRAASEPAAPSQSQSATVNEPSSIMRRWTFENGAPADLEVVLGSWTWRAGSAKTRAVMVPPRDTDVYIELPMDIPQRPILITAKAILSENAKKVHMQTFWSDGVRTLSQRLSIAPLEILESNKTNVIRYYIFDRWMIAYFGDQLGTVIEYDQPYPAKRLIVGLRNFNLEELECRSVLPDEIPAAIRNPQEVRKGIAATPQVTPEILLIHKPAKSK